MDISEFIDSFLPHLIDLYVEGELPLHALVDLDTWKKIFPESTDAEAEQFHWYQISFTGNRLQDGTFLLTFILPQPMQYREPKFAAIRLNISEAEETHVMYYVLRKPASVYDQWDVYQLPCTKGSAQKELKFKCKIDGTDSVRNFVYTVQHLPFSESESDHSAFSLIKGIFKSAFTPQE